MLAREVWLSIVAAIATRAIVSNGAMETSAVGVASKAITETVDRYSLVEAIAMSASAASIATKAKLEKLVTL